MTDSTKQPCAYAEGAYGRAGCGECIECERLSNAMLRTMLHRIARYWTEDEGATPRATRMQRAIDRIPAMLGGTSAPDLAPSARMAARSRCRLDGADAQALEGALRQSETETCRVSDALVEATREITRLRADRLDLQKSFDRTIDREDALRKEVAVLRAENEQLHAARLRPETVEMMRAILADIGDWDAAIAVLRDLNRAYPEEE